MCRSFGLTEKDRAFAKKYARLAVNEKPGHVRFNDSNFHRRGDATIKNERWYPHFIGKLGEIAYGKMVGKSPSFVITPGGDDIDFPGMEVKTRCCNDKNPLLIVKKREFERKKPKQYCLVILEPDFFAATVFGTIDRESFQKKAEPMEMFGREVLALRAEELQEIEPGQSVL